MWQKYKKKNIKNTLCFFIIILIYKVTLELGFWYLLQKAYANTNVYHFEFNYVKYLLGLFWCILLYFLIDHEERKPSTFFLQMQYVIAFIPITVIFAFSNENIIYYTALCFAFAVAEMLVMLVKTIHLPQIEIMTKGLVIAFYLITAVVYFDIIRENGMFTLEAVDIYAVYTLRGDFQLNKYIGYMFDWQYIIITPFFIIRAFQRRKYLTMFFFCGLQFLAYLYAAQKAILFIIPLVLAICILSRLKNFGLYAYSALMSGIVVITACGGISDIMYRLYDLLVRRVFILPANLKFIYYDFFSQNPQIGLAGTLWGKFLEIPNPYDERIGVIISKVYFDNPVMNSNTGFLAEGYYRFGLWGIFLALLLFAFILLMLDYSSTLNGYSFAVSIGFFAMFLLNDGGLIDPLLFGQLTVLMGVCLFYNKKYDFKIVEKHIKKKKIRQLTVA
mgnify:CR=1 FL=1